MEVFYILIVLLIATRVIGEIAVRLGQPVLIGELLAGILLGILGHYFSDRLPLITEMTDDKVFIAITDLDIFFLMLMVGLEMHPTELVKQSGGALFVALGGMVLPLALGIGLGWLYLPDSSYQLAQMMFIGTSLAVTAVPVSVKLLMDLGKLQSRFGRMIVSAAILDDAFVLLLLAILTAFIRAGQMPELSQVLLLTGQILAFFAVTSAIGYLVLPRIVKAARRLIGEESEFATLMIVGMAFALLAEWLQMHFIVGAFIAGLFFTKRALTAETFKDLQRKISGITVGFLAPVFFASIGLHLDLSALTDVPLFVILFILIAMVGKLIGAGGPAYMTGLSRMEAATVGVGMSARGAVELIVAKVALEAGLFEHPEPVPQIIKALFSAVVIMAVATTIIAPPLLKCLAQRIDE